MRTVAAPPATAAIDVFLSSTLPWTSPWKACSLFFRSSGVIFSAGLRLQGHQGLQRPAGIFQEVPHVIMALAGLGHRTLHANLELRLLRPQLRNHVVAALDALASLSS